ncbi:MAG TPA: hypothetical protein VG815_03830, partial [Chloroflexota bacterium]|nr:hypothetical protein [Chloroflexota bacterium]
MSSTLAKPVSRPWHRFLRFSVRGVIVLIVGISVWLAWLVHITRIQRKAVTAIQQAGGSVAYDWTWNNGNDIPGGEPWAPWWLVDLVGVDYFGHVTDVWFHSSSLKAGAALVQAQRLTQIERLSLYDSSVRDADLADLKGLTKLSALILYNTHVTDAGLSNLKGLTKLSAL